MLGGSEIQKESAPGDLHILKRRDEEYLQSNIGSSCLYGNGWGVGGGRGRGGLDLKAGQSTHIKAFPLTIGIQAAIHGIYPNSIADFDGIIIYQALLPRIRPLQSSMPLTNRIAYLAKWTVPGGVPNSVCIFHSAGIPQEFYPDCSVLHC